MSKWVLSVSVGGLAIFGAIAIRHALAEGIPSTGALAYAGTLEGTDGRPLTGDHNVELKFWNVPSGGTAALCTTNPQPVTLENGRFRLALPDECTDATRAHPDIWVEILVDGSSLGRAKAGAVPYAVEAGQSETASTATTASRLGSLSESAVQRRVSSTCAAGSSIRAIAADGTVTCQTDSNTTYAAGSGLTMSGTSIALGSPTRFPASGNFESPINGNAELTTPTPHAFCALTYVRFPADAVGTTHWCIVERNANGTWVLLASSGSNETARCVMTCL
jgi:hypothetical protein